ncbi:hypothetical protein [Sphingobacterium kyonggiense]
MKNMLAIFLLSVYLISTTELSQLLKVPALVEHFFEHKEKDPEMTVMAFLKIHYQGDHFKDHPKDEDYDQDQRLPFMNLNYSSHLFIVESLDSYSKLLQVELIEADHPIVEEVYLKQDFLSSIWQPPKSDTLS